MEGNFENQTVTTESPFLRKFHEAIRNAESLMRAERERGSDNNWIQRFATVMTSVVGYYDLFMKSSHYDEREYAALSSRFADLQETFERRRTEYGPKSDVPEEVREELMAKLKAIEN